MVFDELESWFVDVKDNLGGDVKENVIAKNID